MIRSRLKQTVTRGFLAAAFLLTIAACSPQQQIPVEPPTNGGSADATDPREGLRVDDVGYREATDRFLLALSQSDIAVVAKLMSAHARKEAETQHGTLDAYVITSQANMLKQPIRVSAIFPHPYQRQGDEGVFIELQRGSDADDVLAIFLIAGPEGITVDNVLSRSIHLLPNNAPALGKSNSIPQSAFLSYYLGASVLQHPTPYLVRRVASGGTVVEEADELSLRVVSTPERLVYLRQSCTPAFIERMRNEPEANKNVQTFLEFQRKALEDYDLPRFVGDQLAASHVDVVMSNQKNNVNHRFRFTIKRMHGQCKLDLQEDLP